MIRFLLSSKFFLFTFKIIVGGDCIKKNVVHSFVHGIENVASIYWSIVNWLHNIYTVDLIVMGKNSPLIFIVAPFFTWGERLREWTNKMAVDFEKMLYYWLFLYLCDDDDEDEKKNEWFPSSREDHLVLYFSVGSFRLDLVFFVPSTSNVILSTALPVFEFPPSSAVKF